jgi:DNA polymerase-3 subunit beta
MKFIVPSQLLHKNLQTIGGIITTNNAVPITENVLFEVSAKKLQLTATDLETTITTELELSDSDGDGEIVVPYKRVMETLKSMPDVPVIFEISEEYGIEITADESNFQLAGFDPEDFPEKPALKNASSFEIDAQILCNGITRTIFAVGANDNIRPVLTGVLCEIQPEDITFVGTDAHRLSRYLNKQVKTGLEASFIIPKKPLLLLKNILPGYQKPVRMDFSKEKVAFQLEGLYIVSKQIEGTYPNWKGVIPTSNNNVLTIERLPLLQKVRSVSPYASQATNQVRLKISASMVHLKAEDVDTASKAESSLPCTFEPESPEDAEFEIGFSSKFLQDVLSGLDSNEVIMRLSQPNRAGLVFPVDEGNSDNEDVLMLLMPVMISEY